jgi:hypothetical protein
LSVDNTRIFVLKCIKLLKQCRFLKSFQSRIDADRVVIVLEVHLYVSCCLSSRLYSH